MNVNWNYIKLGFLLATVITLYSFANYRSHQKKVNHIAITFVGDPSVYLTEKAVNTLLIQKHGSLTNRHKETLSLHNLEQTILSNAMVKEAHVYLTVDGKLIAKIVQRKPLGRVQSDPPFYVDAMGTRMPLSPYHSARVPLITGHLTEKTLEGAYTLLNHINTDDFLRKNIVGIHIEKQEKYQLKLRLEDFVVHLGNINRLNKKLNNFKAFYAKAAKDQSFQNYASVNLAFNNQVVCTKR